MNPVPTIAVLIFFKSLIPSEIFPSILAPEYKAELFLYAHISIRLFSRLTLTPP